MGELQEDVAGPLRTLRARFDSEVLPYRPDLWRYCQRLTGSAWDAEDLVQDTLQRAFAGLASLWQPVHPRAWLFRIATNLWIDRYRREVRAEMTELTAEVPGPDVEPLLRAEAHAAVAHLVQMLHQPQPGFGAAGRRAAMDQHLAQPLFQPLDALRHCRGGDAERCRRRLEAAAADDLGQHGQGGIVKH